MKIGTTIDKILSKAKLEPAVSYLPHEDWVLVDKALDELAKTSLGEGEWGVIRNSYLDFLANTSLLSRRLKTKSPNDQHPNHERSTWKQVLFLFRNIRKFYYGKGFAEILY